MIRILVLLMFAELVVVVLLIDVRLDGVEAKVARAGATVLRTYREPPPQPVRQHLASVELRGTKPLPAEADAATEGPPLRLDEQDRRDVIEELYRTERVWRRTAGVLHGVALLRKQGLLAEFGPTQKSRIVQLVRDYAGRRARIELAVMTSDFSDMDRLRAELEEFDGSEADRIEKELGSYLDAALAKRLTRLVVPGR